MKAEDIIESLNQCLEESRECLGIKSKGFFILKREREIPTNFKAFKLYKATVYYSINRNNSTIITVLMTERVTTDDLELAILRKLNIELLKLLYAFIRSELYEKIIRGEYTNDTNE